VGSRQQDYRSAVASFRQRGWRVDEERCGYPLAFCPCGRHKKTIHKTPSNPRYWQNLQAWLDRTECSEEEVGRG
jgi:hypothetical protein